MTGVFLFFAFSISVSAVENIDRALVALEREGGSVFLSWRLFDNDPEGIAFQVKRRSSDQADTQTIVLTKEEPHQLTNFVDETLDTDAVGKTYIYQLCKAGQKSNSTASKPMAEVTITLTGQAKPYITIPLNGDYDFQKVGIADLDGDGAYEFIIKQPNFNTDPYQHPGYWKKSTTTYKIEAYKLDGTMLWRHDMGWSIEAGIWYSPWIVYDVDGDGKAEVYCKAGIGDPRDEKGLVTTGLEFLVKLDGQTGKVLAKTDWLSRDGFLQYSRYCRNFLTVAYLDGKTPSLIMQRGTYNLIKTQALDKDFKKLWYWEAPFREENVRRLGSHGLITADVDEDGRDELVIGAAVIDDNGKSLWEFDIGDQPDVCYVADIDPDNPGLEIFYGLENARETDGLLLVDAKTGKRLWGHDKPTHHIHSQGMVGDILAKYDGMEVYGGEADYKQRWLYSSKGKLIQFLTGGTLSPRPVWWDADSQKEVIILGAIRDWAAQPLQPLEGKVIAVADCLGDHREEVITSLKGELRIYSTTICASQRRAHLMQDHQYRMGIAAQTMGYYYPAQLGK